MVFFYSHNLVYQIEFKIPVNWFNVILQKQIDLKFKFVKATESIITIKTYFDIVNLQHFVKNELLKQTHEKLSRNYIQLSKKINLEKIELLELNDDPDKYNKIINICKSDGGYITYKVNPKNLNINLNYFWKNLNYL